MHSTYEANKKAKEIALEALRLARISGDRFCTAWALRMLAGSFYLDGQMEQAFTSINEANEIFESLGFRGRFTLPGVIAYFRGDYDQAREYFIKTMNEMELLGEKNVRSLTLFWLGVTFQNEGNLEQARAFLEKALAIQKEVRQIGHIVRTLSMLGQVLSQQGELEKAILMSKKSLLLTKEFNFWFRKAETLILSAWLFIERSPQTAMCLLATAYAKYQTADSPMDPFAKIYYEQYLAVARSKLDEQAFKAAWAEGEKMSIDQAIDYALSEIGEMEKNIPAK